MTDKREISICIPTYQREAMTIDAFRDVYSDERVGQIVIVDDASDTYTWEKLNENCAGLDKVKLIRNEVNVDCYINKFLSITHADLDYCILLDSDNKIDKNYIDIIFSLDWDAKKILTPSFAKPQFDFTQYEGIELSKKNIQYYIDKPMVEVCLNACNYFVNRMEYLKVWDDTIDPVTSDSIYFISKWFEAGNNLYIVPNLNYEHRVHTGSHYMNNVLRTPIGFHESILNKLRGMK